MRSIAFSLLLVSASIAAAPADILFVGDNILTMEEASSIRPTAVAIDADRIVWVGDRKDSAPWTDKNTKVIELGEQALLPGFIDAHGHFLFTAATVDFANVSSPPVGTATDIAALKKVLTDHIRENQLKPGEWVIGYGYDDSLLAEKRHPTRDDLDAVSTDHPIVLSHVSGHLMAANSQALAAASITSQSPNPDGGAIRRRECSTEPNGVLEETATYALRKYAAPKWSADLIRRALLAYAAFGVTTIQDAASDAPSIALLRQFADAGVLSQDILVYPVLRPADLKGELPHDFRTTQNGLRVAGVKLVLDGSPQGKTAYLSQPYHRPPAGKPADYRGYPIHQQSAVDQLVDYALSRKIQLIAHANGDATGDMLLDAVEKSLGRMSTMPDHRTVMIHAQTVRTDQLDRMRELQLMPSFFSAHTFYWGDWHRDSVLGGRAERISPTRSALDRGIPFTVHNDSPVVPSNMIRLLWATTNRQTRSGKVLGADQRVSTEEALAAMTRTAAWQNFEADRKGTLTAGKLADLVVLSANPLKLETQKLMDLQVMATYSRGVRLFVRSP
jgi:predicted amidohydrolase YtcJ